MKKYVVREGDTMWSIAQATGVRPKLLIASNPQVKNPNQLRPGSVIVIPELTKGKETTGKGGIGAVHPEAAHSTGTGGTQTTPGTPPPHPTAVPASSTSGTPQTSAMPGTTGAQPSAKGAGTATPGGLPPFFGFVWPHAVQPGESWSSIQKKYNVQMQHLVSMNPGMANRPLRPGDLLYIPGMVPPSNLPSWAGQGMGMPGQGMPTQGMPTQGMPTQGMPTQGMPTQGMPTQGMPTQGMPTQGMPGTGQGYPYPTDPQAASQWSEPYGPHQHNPFRYEEVDAYADNPWRESSSWDLADGDVATDWRSGASGTFPYHKFDAPKPHASEISVYLGDPEEGSSQDLS